MSRIVKEPPVVHPGHEDDSLTGIKGASGLDALGFIVGLSMVVSASMALQHYYAANYPSDIFKGEFCDVNSHCNCDSFDYSSFSQIAAVPIAYFGIVMGSVFGLGAMIPSRALERVNRTLSLCNCVVALGLVAATTLYLKAICLVGVTYGSLSLIAFLLMAKRGPFELRSIRQRWFTPPAAPLVAIVIFTLLGAFGLRAFAQAKEEASVHRAVEQYYSLAKVQLPSFISPYWTARATDRFEDAPIQVIAYSDLICDNSSYVEESLYRLKADFRGYVNIVWQFFPLEAKCNQVSGKDKHPGGCEAAYIAAYNPSKFVQIHDELLTNWEKASDSEWRHELAMRYGVEKGITDSATQALVERIIQTGKEYQRTSDQYPYGIRSTPTMIVNNRMIIGTYTYPQLHAIFQRLLDEHEGKYPHFMENWPDQPK